MSATNAIGGTVKFQCSCGKVGLEGKASEHFMCYCNGCRLASEWTQSKGGAAKLDPLRADGLEIVMCFVETIKFTKGDASDLVNFCITNPPNIATRFRCKHCNTMLGNQVKAGLPPVLALYPGGCSPEYSKGNVVPLTWQQYGFAKEGKEKELLAAKEGRPEKAQIFLSPKLVQPPAMIRAVLKHLCGPFCCCCHCDPVCVPPMLCCTCNVDPEVKKVWKADLKKCETLLPGVKEPNSSHTLADLKDPTTGPGQQTMD